MAWIVKKGDLIEYLERRDNAPMDCVVEEDFG